MRQCLPSSSLALSSASLGSERPDCENATCLAACHLALELSGLWPHGAYQASRDPFLFTPQQSCQRALAERGGAEQEALLCRPGRGSSLRCGPLSNGHTSFSTPLPAHSHLNPCDVLSVSSHCLANEL
ncbi:hypothetical protein MHYP_G00225540 [Metynnis hypsauchen]